MTPVDGYHGLISMLSNRRVFLEDIKILGKMRDRIRCSTALMLNMSYDLDHGVDVKPNEVAHE